MPVDNENRSDLIDVGEADQKATEINLDDKGEPEKKEPPKEEKIEVEEIAEKKMQDLNAADMDAAVKIISGSARSMGIEVID